MIHCIHGNGQVCKPFRIRDDRLSYDRRHRLYRRGSFQSHALTGTPSSSPSPHNGDGNFPRDVVRRQGDRSSAARGAARVAAFLSVGPQAVRSRRVTGLSRGCFPTEATIGAVLIVGFMAVLAMTGCSTHTTALGSARYSYEQASSNPTVAANAPETLGQAQMNLQRAEESNNTKEQERYATLSQEQPEQAVQEANQIVAEKRAAQAEAQAQIQSQRAEAAREQAAVASGQAAAARAA